MADNKASFIEIFLDLQLISGPVMICLIDNTGKYSPSSKGNTKNELSLYCTPGKANTIFFFYNVYILIKLLSDASIFSY